MTISDRLALKERRGSEERRERESEKNYALVFRARECCFDAITARVYNVKSRCESFRCSLAFELVDGESCVGIYMYNLYACYA